MEVIDAQVHVLEADGPQRPWTPPGRALGAGTVVSGDEMVAAMDAAGVDGAVLVSAAHYGWDNSYALEVAARYPQRFRVVGMLDHDAPDVAERVAAWADEPLGVGVRVKFMHPQQWSGLREGRYASLFAAAEAHQVPLVVLIYDYLAEVGEIARAHPELPLVLDHMGLPIVLAEAPGVDHFANLPQVLDLARFPNVSVKLTAAPSLSNEPHPYCDLWPHLRRYIDAFGADRLMWGSDWTRVRRATYAEGVTYITENTELDDDQTALLCAGTLRRVLGWKAASSLA